MKLEDFWHNISGYIFYLMGATLAIFTDVIVGVISYVLQIPNDGEIRLEELMLGDKAGAMDTSDFIIRVVDGHLFLWDISVTELMQICLLTVSFLGAAIKIVIDLHKYCKGKKEEKETTVLKRRNR